FLEDPSDESPKPQNAADEKKPAEKNYCFYFWGIRKQKTLIAAVSLISLPLPSGVTELSDDGWEWACRECIKNEPHNAICLLSAAIDPNFQNLGLSKTLLNQVKQNACSLGFSKVIAPVRPSHKSYFPEMSLSEYLQKKTENGEVFDPWLRTHFKLGGRHLNICSRSVVISASLNRWREWTGLNFNDDQKSFLPQQVLNPVQIEGEKGVYVEPNVWVIYELGNS
ncbi:MAG: GNAT family N-acetyltransferase, partial [Bdellovibrionales bacterium]|nr:GNAT family N-acetyltransferase [Bdellovibrionales bacterium]